MRGNDGGISFSIEVLYDRPKIILDANDFSFFFHRINGKYVSESRTVDVIQELFKSIG